MGLKVSEQVLHTSHRHLVYARLLLHILVKRHLRHYLVAHISEQGIAVAACVAIEHRNDIGRKKLRVKFLARLAVHNLSSVIRKNVPSPTLQFQTFCHGFNAVGRPSRCQHNDSPALLCSEQSLTRLWRHHLFMICKSAVEVEGYHLVRNVRFVIHCCLLIEKRTATPQCGRPSSLLLMS